MLNAPETTLVNVQKNLYALKDFLARNPHLFHSSPSEPSSTRSLVTEQEAWKVSCSHLYQSVRTYFFLCQAEQNSVSELQSLLSRTIEALSFVLLLNDYQLGDLISK